MVRIHREDDKGRRTFRVFDHLLVYPSFQSIILKEWEKPLPAKGFELIYAKLENTKKRLKGLHSFEFGNVAEKID